MDCRTPFLRHARYYARLAAEATRLVDEGPGAVGLLQSADAWENIDRGFQWTRAASAPDEDAYRLCIEYFYGGAPILFLRHQLDALCSWSQAALDAATILRDEKARGFALWYQGRALTLQGQDEAAGERFEQALQITAARGEPAHEVAGFAVYGLAIIRSRQGRTDEAERLFIRAVSLFEGAFNPGHPNTAVCLLDLVEFYCKNDRLIEAEPLAERALLLLEAFDPGHPNTALAYSRLGRLRMAQKRFKEAAALFVDACRIHKSVFYPEHPETITNNTDLATAYQMEGRLDDAANLLLEVLRLQRSASGQGDLDVSNTLAQLAAVYLAQHRYDEAHGAAQDAFVIREETLGANDIATQFSLNFLAGLVQRTMPPLPWGSTRLLVVDTPRGSRYAIVKGTEINLERFSMLTRRIIFFSRYEASQRGSRQIEPGDVLLGVVRDLQGPHALLLSPHRETIRQALLGRPESAGSTSVEIPFSDETKEVFARAALEADRHLSESVEPSHLLLALLDVNGDASRLLASLGLTSAIARKQIFGRLENGESHN